ncbi:Alpha-mannosidase [Geitlerinema sp. FC II]|nr:Alpha-mannosidase [Geitlerinema sp. FC II]
MERLAQAIARLKQLCRLDILESWRFCDADIQTERAVPSETWQNWQPVTLNSRRHISWKRGKRVLWLSQTLVVPEFLNDYDVTGLALRLSLRWWAEDAKIFVNGTLIREGDLFDCFGRLLLRESVRPGDCFNLAIRLVSPGHDDGALVTSELIYESEEIDPGFIADELAVCEILHREVRDFSIYIDVIDWEALPSDRDRFHRSLSQLRQILETEFPKSSLTVSLLGHAHLDMAWLWPVSETWDAAQRTFESVLSLQQEFSELIFCHSSPALYDWIETHHPDVFAEIQNRVKSGVWEIAAGLWVEPEFNLVSGESIVRQILYGQHYTREKFGEISRVAWLPDSFGFCWQLPQLLKAGGIDYFVTQKLRWNDTTEFPYEWFRWQSPDGSEILSWMSSPIGQDIDPQQIARYAKTWQEKTGLSEALWLPGVGDHGGGPTRDMLEVARRWQRSPQFPQLQFSKATDFLDRLAAASPQPPVWRNELYLEYHRGCYTSHGDRKLANRRGERGLYQAEVLASVASRLAKVPYPKAQLDRAWKLLLFDQFHDILPGSAIPEVFRDADRSTQEIDRTVAEVVETSLNSLTQLLKLPPPQHSEAVPVYCVNVAGGDRSEVVVIQVPDPSKTWRACDIDGKPLQSILFRDTLQVYIPKLPEMGITTLWIEPSSLPARNYDILNYVTKLQNTQIRVKIDEITGNLASIFHVKTQQEILNSSGGDRLQFFEDKGQYWDAWNIDPNYEEKPLEAATLESITCLEYSEIRQRVRVVQRFRNSRFIRDYILDIDSPILKIETRVDWREPHVLVKTAFGLNLNAESFTTETPFGAIARPTRPQTEAEKAKWEVPALQWADLSGDRFGVSLLNNCKHGYDAKPNQLRLTLLRGSTWPDPDADFGEHRFSYAIYPHSGDWRDAETVRWGYRFNQPVVVRLGNSQTSSGHLPPSMSWLTVKPKHFVVTAFKQAEDASRGWILRGYDSIGNAAKVEFDSVLGGAIASRVDGLERDIEGSENLEPWQVASFRIEP